MLNKRHGAGNDVYVVRYGKLQALISNRLGVIGQFSYGLCPTQLIELIEQRRVEQLGEHNEVGVVATYRIDKKFYLLEELFGRGELAHLPLYQPQPYY